MKYWFLYILVFISGGSILGIEILGTRILGPFYGVNLFLWSALISVTLISLSVGYIIGGRWADKGPKVSHLYYVLMGAGIWILIIPWIKQPLLYLSEPLGLRYAVLIAAFILFTPPLTLLGMISPYAVKLKVSSLNVVGQTAGDLYAISTIGSVISALLTGFVLIPNFGVSGLTRMIGLILLFIAVFGFINCLPASVWLRAFLISIFAGIALLGITFSGTSKTVDGLLVKRQTPYAEIRVLDKDSLRYLLIDGGIHTIVDPLTWESHFPYTAIIDISKDFFSKPGKVLLIGLGGGSVVKNFSKENWKTDAVEIDPVVVEIAYEHFGLEKSEAEIYCTDGRQFLRSRTDIYNLIIMDAFGSSSIPFHLITKESFGLIVSRLTPEGIFVINLESRSWNDIIIKSITATLKTQFLNVIVLPAHKKRYDLGNVIVLASNRSLEIQRDMPSWVIPPREYLFSQDYLKDFAWRNKYAPDIKDAPILTDDLNPVDLWSESINYQARKQLHSFFEQEKTSW